jgi:hypothetical protein
MWAKRKRGNCLILAQAEGILGARVAEAIFEFCTVFVRFFVNENMSGFSINKFVHRFLLTNLSRFLLMEICPDYFVGLTRFEYDINCSLLGTRTGPFL